MTDSVAVFPPGYRITDSATGAPISGAVVYFYDAGTTNPKPVYADDGLLTSLGTSVTCDSLGRPTSDGSTPTDIYVGTSDYKTVIKDSGGNTIETKDNRKGAVVSSSTADVSVTAAFPVVTKSLDYTIVSGDQNTIFAVNCSSGDVNITLPSAVTVGTGWQVALQHVGTTASAHKVIIKTVSSQTISEGSKSFGVQYVLIVNGEDCHLTSDGGNWRISSHTNHHVKYQQGVLTIVSRLATPPGSPAAGDCYIVLSSPTGAWSGFAQHDIAIYNGTTWVNFTPVSDGGWIAFVQNENLYYHYMDSAWVVETATSTVQGTTKVSTQAIMETATATDTAVNVGHQQFHPGHPKWWLEAAVSAGTPTVGVSYNNTSITDTATGRVTATIATDFSSAAWCAMPNIESDASNALRSVNISNGALAAGTVEISCRDTSATLTDPAKWFCSGLGDQ